MTLAFSEEHCAARAYRNKIIQLAVTAVVTVSGVYGICDL